MQDNAETAVGDGTYVTKYDEYLVPFVPQLRARYSALQSLKDEVSNIGFVGGFLVMANEREEDPYKRRWLGSVLPRL